MKRIRILLRTDDNNKIGGVRQVYRHVDVLNQLGYDAAVIHPTKGFRCSWFQNDTKTIGFEELSLDENDYLVLPELDQDVPTFPGSDKCKVIVLAQNPWGFLRGFGGLRTLFDFYRDRVSAVICVSEHSRKYLQALLPSLKVHRIRYSFDKPPFSFGTAKERLIAFMPRRRSQEMDTILYTLQHTGCFKGWNVVPIMDCPEEQVADVMRRASVFMASGAMEGFGMPAAEAMASGCVVVGWHGYGGEEAFSPEFSYPVPDGDVFAYIEAVKAVLSKSLDEINDMGRRASEITREAYSTKNEIESIKSAWRGIMGEKEEVQMPEKSFFPLQTVAAYMHANEENAYIERILKWLSPRVGKIFIAEGEKSCSGTVDRDQQLEVLIKRLAASGITNIEHVITKYRGMPNAAINETYMRNEALDAIQKQGFKWVWVVDSDETYCDAEAENLWKWFFSQASDDLKFNKIQTITGARCQWYTYWRSVHWRIDPPEGFRPNIILRADQRFSLVRNLADERGFVDVPTNVCMPRHYSWAHSPATIEKKVATWAHSHQVLPGWYENVWLKWTPGCNMENLHPTEPAAYRRAVRCDKPIPELMIGHPYLELDLIDCDDHSSPAIKVVILNHNKPENADKLFEQLSKAFDVAIWDSGSDPDKIPIHVTRSFPNIYWTGAWNEIMRTHSGYDAVWMIGCDIELKSEPIEYRNAIEAALPFGCWSPCIEGRAHPFMQSSNYTGLPMSVKNIEGMALAVSGRLMREVKELVAGSPIGFGQDFWLCHKAREMGMENVIDGRVKLFHPEGIGYDEKEALQQMETAFSNLYGSDFRNTVFEYDERYEGNLVKAPAVKKEVLIPEVVRNKPFTIVTVDNGWGFAEFVRITSQFPSIRKVIMAKGVAEFTAPSPDFQIVKYDADLKALFAEVDIALFSKVGSANKNEYFKLLQAGIPVIVNVAHHQGVIEHMKNGYFYQDESWAANWIRELTNPSVRKNIKTVLLANPPKEKVMSNITGCGSCEERRAKAMASVAFIPEVTVITPTYKRDPKIIKRSIDCMKLQTFPSWEQLVCSDGEVEAQAKQVVEEAADHRVVYCHVPGKKEGDFGNTVRSEMLKQARGKFVLFLDDDNIILPQYLETMVTRLVNAPDYGFAVCKVMHFGPLNEATGKPPMVLKGDPVKLYHIDPLQVLVRADVMKQIGWDTEVGYLSDGVTLEKLGAAHKHVRVEEVLGVHV